MKAIDPEEENADSVFITKICFVAAGTAGMMISVFPYLSGIILLASIGYSYYFIQNKIVRNIKLSMCIERV